MAGSVAGLFAGRLLVGLGVSVIFVSLIKTYSAWFRPNELGTAMGLTVSLGNLGGILATSPLAALVELLGWRCAFAVVGLFSLLVAVLSWLIIRTARGTFFPSVPGRPQKLSGKPSRGPR